MSHTSGHHGDQHSELVSLYALQALPSGDVPAAEAQFAACAECRQELATLRPVLDAFVAWPTDILRPTVSLWPRLVERIASETGEQLMAPEPPPWTEPEWHNVAEGIACKLLATDMTTNVVSMLVRLAPGADYPPHRHAGTEELHMLHGELIVNGQTLYPGDHYRGEAGTVDRQVRTATGCTGILITSFRDTLV